jgi:hypothetical protein
MGSLAEPQGAGAAVTNGAASGANNKVQRGRMRFMALSLG